MKIFTCETYNISQRKATIWINKMPQQVRALDLSLTSSTHMVEKRPSL